MLRWMLFSQLFHFSVRETRLTWSHLFIGRQAALTGLSVGLCFLLNSFYLPAEEPSAEQIVDSMQRVLVTVIERTQPSIVAIARIRKRGENSALSNDDEFFLQPQRSFFASSPTRPDFLPHEFASGVVIGEQGLILTTYHALGEVERSEYVVWTNGRPFAALVKAADPWLDVAVLEIKARELKPIPFGTSKSLQKGQMVIALGNPLGIARDGRASASWGIIANLDRLAPSSQSSARTGKETLHHYGTLIQTDLRQPIGASGGALLNMHGEMIGLSTTWCSLAQQDCDAGFAIPTDTDFLAALETLKQGRIPSYGFLGFAPGLLELADRQAGQQGVIVEDVVAGTPAAQAGLQRGDRCTHIDEVPVRDDLQFIRLVSAKQAQTRIQLTVLRSSGRTEQVSVRLSKKWIDGSREAIAQQSSPSWRGLQVEFSTAMPRFRELSPFLDPAGCVSVLEVEQNSPAWKAGVRVGQFICRVAGERVSNPEDFFKAVNQHPGTVEVLVRSSNEPEKTISIPAE